MDALGTAGNPLRAAIVGSGPSGFYAAEALLRSGRAVHVDMLERLPAPFGLVRYGVAPDHPKLKEPILVYDRIARSGSFAFFGNVTVGRDASVAELQATHHVVVFACGAETDRRLGIPGEALPGSHTATEFVGWYNGHPDYRDRQFDFSHEVAVIIGQGNVAADVCRVLAKSVDELRHTDIAQHALEALARSRVREIHVIGRRGPTQAKFTPQELKELGELANCDPVVDSDELVLNAPSEAERADKMNRAGARNIEILRGFSTRPQRGGKRCHFRFLLSPVEIRGGARVERVLLERNRLEGEAFKQVAVGIGEKIELECGLLFRSIGYRGVPIPGVSYDNKRGVIPNRDGRVLIDGEPAPGLYVTGWIKRGPSGIIGTNRADSVATVAALLEDLPQLTARNKAGSAGLHTLLANRGVRVIDYSGWLNIDRAEIERGQAKGKPREKFTACEEMLAVITQETAASSAGCTQPGGRGRILA